MIVPWLLYAVVKHPSLDRCLENRTKGIRVGGRGGIGRCCIISIMYIHLTNRELEDLPRTGLGLCVVN